jgi:hypothetical protein
MIRTSLFAAAAAAAFLLCSSPAAAQSTIAPDGVTFAGTLVGAGPVVMSSGLPYVDGQTYRSVDWNLIGLGGGTATFQASTDKGVTWASVTCAPNSVSAIQGPTSVTSNGGIWSCPAFPWNRINMSGGTGVNVTATMKQQYAPAVTFSATTFGGDARGAWEHGFPSGTLTDRSVVIGVGGVAQTAANTLNSRLYLFCQNPSVAASGVAAENVYIGINATATTTGYELVNGQSITFENGFIPTGLVSILAATTGHKVTCKEG